MYEWQKFYQEECKTGRFKRGVTYQIRRRGYTVTLRYFGSVCTQDGRKTADVFNGTHDGGTNKGEMMFFALMNNQYATSNNVGDALQKLWSGKTNKLKEIVQQERTKIVRG